MVLAGDHSGVPDRAPISIGSTADGPNQGIAARTLAWGHFSKRPRSDRERHRKPSLVRLPTGSTYVAFGIFIDVAAIERG